MCPKIYTLGFHVHKVIRKASRAIFICPTSNNFINRRSFATHVEGGVCVGNIEVKSFIERAMVAVGTKPAHATSLADNLTMADYRGHFSHGLNRLEIYVEDIKSGISVCDHEPEIVRETSATALVDGNNLLGTVVGTFSMKVAIQKAKNSGIGFVAAKSWC